MTRAHVLTVALCLALAGCGSNTDDPTVAAPPAPSATTGAPTPSAAATPQECPLKPTAVPAPAGAVTDLKKKPTIAGRKGAPPEDVQVADLVVGKGAEATTLSNVEVKYVGALYTTGKEFDSSWSRGADETLPFTVCSTGTVPGFAIGPLGMKVGGRRQVTIPGQYGYGAQGQPDAGIAPNAALVFVIDLLKVTPPES